MATTFAQRVSMVLERSNLNQTDFSARIPISQQYLSQICSGKKEPSDRVIWSKDIFHLDILYSQEPRK